MMKKTIMALAVLCMSIGAFAATLGDGIGVPSLTWTSEGDEGPWHYSSNEGYGGNACVISGGGGGGTATSWLRATVDGPCRISFRYLVQTYTGTYTVKSDDSVLYTWTGITGTGAQWQSAQYDIPSGSHVLEFSYTHKGVGYANQFNGVKICELAIQSTGNAGGTLYVSPDGNDSNDGTSWATAKATIQAAIDASFAGDTILVAPGTYTRFESFNKRITIEGIDGPNATIVDGDGNYSRDGKFKLDDDLAGWHTNTVLRGFTIQHLTHIVGGTLIRCVIRDNNCGSVGNGAVVGAVAVSCLIMNNVGMNGAAGDGSIFKNCTMVGNSAVSGYKGVTLNSVLENCIVFNNGNDERQTWSYWFDQSLLADWDHRDVNTFVGNPGFVNAANGDYRLTEGSPCIDAGDNSYVAADKDLDGNPRIVNGTVDLGAYEYFVDPNIPQVSVRFVVAYDGGEDVVRSYYEGSRYNSFPGVSRNGYTFVGWFTEAIGGEQIVASQTVDPSITTLYAHWVSYADGQRMALDLGSDGTLGDDGSLIWTVDSTTSHHGGSSLKSATITHSQSTWQTLAVNGSGTLSFWWKVSSEGNYDWLRYYVDGVQGGQISGSTDWAQVTVNLEGDGVHVIKWEYSKDGSVDSGSNCGWIDQVEWSGLGAALHSVTFDMNGGGEAVVRDCEHGAPVGELPTAVRSGYVFAGWFTARVGGVQVGSGYVVDSDKILYAHWIPEGEVMIVSTKVRDDDPSVLDVVYRVNSTNATANVRALAFEDGEESFAKVIRPETFIDGTETNLGYAVAANVDLTLSWRVTDDWNVRLARVKFMILVEENFYPLSLDLVTIPANGSNRAVRFSTNEINEEAFRDALFWLYASHDEGLALENGVLSAGGVTLANGAEIVHPEAERYVFKSMDYQLLEGANLQYVNETARINLNPQGSRQYVFKQN